MIGPFDAGSPSVITLKRTLLPVSCLLVLLALARPAQTSSPPPLVKVRIAYQQRDELTQLEQAGVDIWEVQPGYAIALVSNVQRDALIGQDYELEELNMATSLSTFDPEYHTYEELVVELQNLAGAYPDLVQLVNVGESWETAQGRAERALWALKIRTNPQDSDSRPKVLFVAAIHARELATVEVALTLATYLLENYSANADVTYLLETSEAWILPMANPDGHIHAEGGESWRKNTNDSLSLCPGSWPPNSYGVDLNRNFAYQWGGNGSSSDPCYSTYRGAGALSEPEDRALADLIQEQMFGLTVSYHSYGELVLYPWGYTDVPPPDEALFGAIARRLASHNGYEWGQASTTLYAAHGDLDDWAYYETGALSFTIEVGRSFDPPYDAVEGLWQENREPALYLLKIADDPLQAYGPEAVDISVMIGDQHLTLTALLSDVHSGDQDIAAGELFVDTPGDPGAGLPLSPADGVFDSSLEQAKTSLPWLGPEQRSLYVRGQDADGHWGPLSAVFWKEHQVFAPLVAR
jgi:carboxypeptidase T